MNHFSYEVMGKEKVKGLQDEGMKNQAIHKSSLLRGVPKLLLFLLGILGLFVR